jgi:Pregnancy-associated plasma protein-A/Secretion system C-terminal sorting domain
MKKVVLIVFLVALTFSVRAQRTCATTEVNQLNKSTEQLRLEKASFEEWLVQKRAQFVTQNGLQGPAETVIYQIPVVVHIIHNGEAIGNGYNISDAQIASQIEALNRDFRHLNADSINTPALFQPLMADIGFEFVLAKRDPLGLPTNGIKRVNGNSTIWSFGQNAILKSLSYWSSDDYFNIWVAPLGANNLGWAEFPTSTIINGVNDVAVNNSLTDGIVINSKAFGSVEIYPQGNYLPGFNLGRTTTHEVGHFFGLRHTWGDGNCGVDDFVADTPNTNDPYYYCPPDGSFTNSCAAEVSMYMNYMEYVDDRCMNLFSLGQKDRMVIVVNNSPRRASLLSSLALLPPPVTDIAVIDIPSPDLGVCDNNILPTVTIRNTGTSLVTEVVLSIYVDQVEQVQQTFAVSLLASTDTTLVLPGFILTQFGNLSFAAKALFVNGQIDNILGNNSFSKDIFFSEVVTAIVEDFNVWPQSWAIRTDAPVSKWNFLQAPNVVITNTAAVLNYYQNNSPFLDQLVSPIIDLSAYSKPTLLFDHAYAEIAGFSDRLAVVVSLDCGNTFQDTLFLKSGSALATTEIPVKFTPSGPIDWRTNTLDLSAYVSQPIQIAFIGKSAGGNNIYLDNFLLVDEGYQDASLKGLLNESAAFGANIGSLGLIVENTGLATINNLTIEVSEGTNLISSQPFTNLNLLSGERRTLFFDNKITTGKHNLIIRHTLNDKVAANNQLQVSANFLALKESIPYREKINSGTWNEVNDWTTSSPNGNNNWQIWPLSNDFLFYPAFEQGNTGLHHWLVLPKFSFGIANVAALQFKVAYASNELNNEALRIWASINNGESFELVETLTNKEMSTYTSAADWYPVIPTDWINKFVDLSDFAGEEDVFIAFEAIDGDGSNIYLDDIELFIANEPNMIKIGDDQIAVYPNPVSDNSTRISFNLTTKQDVNIRIIDAVGNTISNQRFTNVLNQTYPLELNTQRNGIYIIQAIGVDFNDVLRILVSR